ncbi:MAG: response regulator transcription factor [Chitinophagaceae bacterium]|nr:response regulator transcription factor [Chitinophagaceae bacterium]
MRSNGLKYNVLIVDDNSMARILLMQLLEQIPTVTVLGECDNAVDAITILSKDETDILFLDIEMPGMSGIELLQSLKVRPVTIFMSANKGYGSEAFELNVVDYLVKPLLLPRTMMAINRATELLNQKEVYLNEVEAEYLFIKENKIIRKLLIDDIYLLESKGDYVKIYVADKYYVIHATLKLLEDRLSAAKFVRVHRSYIVAIDKIDYIEENILYLNNTPVPLSESYRSQFLKKLNLL